MRRFLPWGLALAVFIADRVTKILAPGIPGEGQTLIPGVLGNGVSADTDSFMNGLLEYPQYSRPEIWRGKQVPPILLSGDHAKVDRWRKEQSLARTRERRPDLYRKYMEEHPEAEGGAKGKKSR